MNEQKEILVLGLEASGNKASVALVSGGTAIEQIIRPERHGHAASITLMVEACLDGTGRNYREITHLAVGCGPGSFTGIRVAIAAAKGLSLGLNVPLYGISSLDALARKKTGSVLALTDTRRGHSFACLYRDGRAVSPVIEGSGETIWEKLARFHDGGRVHIIGHDSGVAAVALERGGIAIETVSDDDPDAAGVGLKAEWLVATGAEQTDAPPRPHYHAEPMLGPSKRQSC